MRKIFKYSLQPKINMPADAHVLRVGLQASNPFLWAIFDEANAAEVQLRHFEVVGTGQDIDENLDYIGTYDADPFVWHVFERLNVVTEPTPQPEAPAPVPTPTEAPAPVKDSTDSAVDE